MQTQKEPDPKQPAFDRTIVPTTDADSRPVSSLHRFVPYRSTETRAETVVSGFALFGLLCFAGLLFATVFDTGVLA